MVFTMICLLEAKADKIEAMKNRILESAPIFRKDPETIEWTVQQDLENPAKFIIVERFETEDSERIYHQGNPIFQPLIDFLDENMVRPYELHTFTT
ncbi:uncharacterized protein I206_106920 [Kwoniella pini CBS 10737]|uniref:ABM domain-containing protein n=1 Tax=Kwoniella pini CBS 10737 TaxID=1296096 RepID=A0A1B9HZR8_9TREE|nr:uncharacterized protein I206_05535 [Kwoniella pini CBS 10737]OCF48754.1 hypothetical protein I206_05535 [Kwoniella pini CBS 10737]